MSKRMSRRAALQNLALLIGAGSVLAETAAQAAGDLPHLAQADPTAQALGYHDSANTVDAKQFTTYQPAQSCSTCMQLQGTAGQPWRPCTIFPGKLVNANGWCKVWVKKP
jgi:FtsP/CotA-like multicopper oxidase with cupredoxin domain